MPTIAEPIHLTKDLGNRYSTCATRRKALRAVTFALTHVFEADNIPIHNVKTSDERFLLGWLETLASKYSINLVLPADVYEAAITECAMSGDVLSQGGQSTPRAQIIARC